MPKIRHYYNGISIFMPSGITGKPKGLVKRDKTKGWTSSATNNNKKFLQSVMTDQITGFGIALTLTVKDCPPTPNDWHNARKAFIKRLKRKGMTRYHWVTEWQSRGHPHLHMSAYFDYEPTQRQQNAMRKDWLEIAKPFKAGIKGQHIKPINNVKGWLEYSAKHGARGVNHYQRSGKPKAWESSTGRVWGYGGEWPRMQEDTVIFSEQFFKARRFLKNWRIGDARKTPIDKLVDATGKELPKYGDIYEHMLPSLSKKRIDRIKYAKKCLQANTRERGQVRAMSEWMPLDVQIKILEFVSEGQGLPHQNKEVIPC